MAKYFSDGDIYFSVDSITEIHSDSRYSGNIISWMNDNPHDDAIDIYLYPDNVYNGGSSDTVPSIHLIIGGEKDNTELVQSGVLAHEIGHCLGLYHTHRGYDGVSGACEETGPENCEDCGDFICDTPPDPGLFNRITEEYYVDSNCQFCCTEDTSTFDPDTYNTMSYTLPKCNSYFSEGQFDRVFATLDSVTVADSALIDTLGSYSSPSTPSGLSWSNLNGHPLLSWNIHPDIDVAGYDIFRKFNSGAWIKIGYSAGRVINHFYDSQIDIVSPKFPPGYVYYKIKAYTIKRSVKSSFSNQVSVPTNTSAKQLVNEKKFTNTQNDSKFSVYPNPFNSTTTINISVKSKSNIFITIYDLLGREIKSYSKIDLNGGVNAKIDWDRKNNNGLAILSGVYFCQRRIENIATSEINLFSRKIVVIK